MKYLSLLTLTLQNAAMALTMRQARTQTGDMFLASTAVIVTEFFKLVCCFIMIFFDEGMSVSKTIKTTNDLIVKQPFDTLKVSSILAFFRPYYVFIFINFFKLDFVCLLCFRLYWLFYILFCRLQCLLSYIIFRTTYYMLVYRI